MKQTEFQTVMAKLTELGGEIASARSAVEASEKARSEWSQQHEKHDTERFAAHSEEQRKTNEAVAELKKAQDAQLQARVVELTGQLSMAKAKNEEKQEKSEDNRHEWLRHTAMVLLGAFLMWLLKSAIAGH